MLAPETCHQRCCDTFERVSRNCRRLTAKGMRHYAKQNKAHDKATASYFNEPIVIKRKETVAFRQPSLGAKRKQTLTILCFLAALTLNV